jgi:hypothetical protein
MVLLLVGLAVAQLPDAPSESRRVADGQFWALTAFNAAATAADMVTTSAMVSHTEACPFEVATPALYGDRAPDGRVVAVMAGKAVAATFASYLLKKYNVHVWKLKLWYAPLGFKRTCTR